MVGLVWVVTLEKRMDDSPVCLDVKVLWIGRFRFRAPQTVVTINTCPAFLMPQMSSRDQKKGHKDRCDVLDM